MTAPAPADRVIPGQRLRDVQSWAWLRAPLLREWTCAERVLAVVAELVADDAGGVVGDVLAAAIAEPDTVECALALLDDAGLSCA